MYLISQRAYLRDLQDTAAKYAPIEERFLQSAANRNYRSTFDDMLDDWTATPMKELSIIKQTLPSEAHVTDMQLRSGTLTIQGYANSDADVVAFVAALRNADGYYSATVTQSNRVDSGWTFTVEWLLVSPVTPTPRPTMGE